MNRSSKLIIAAALLAAGYGVASLLGSPRVPYLAAASLHGEMTTQHAQSPQRAANEGRSGSLSGASVRLLPEVAATPPQNEAARDSLPANSEFALAQSVASPYVGVLPSGTTGDFPATQSVDVSPPPMAAPAFADEPARVGPRATLKSAPPRPLRFNDPADVLTTQPSSRLRDDFPVETSGPAAAARQPQSDPSIMPSSYLATGSPPVTLSGPVARAIPPLPTQILPVGPISTAVVETPRPAITGMLRVHTIIDGDSLPKLAVRYLRDAKRSDEIFALNRDVLSSPELLPIGAELKIPPTPAGDRGG